MLEAGFSRLDITPPLGADLSGYFVRRISDGILDGLYVNTVCVGDGENTLILMALDYIGVRLNYADKIRDHVAGRLGIPREFVYVAALHQHTSPCLDDNRDTRLRDEAFKDVLIRRLGDSAVLAFQDMKPAKLFCGAKTVSEPIAFVRRYFTESDGVQTNPRSKYVLTGRCAEADNDLRLIKFEVEGGGDIAVLNFSTHPDVIGGNKFSADWPGFARRFTEQLIPGVRAAFFTGCQGDSNHIDFFKPKTERLKGGEGYAHSRFMGETVAKAAVAAWKDAKPVSGEKIFAESAVLDHRPQRPSEAEFQKAKAWYADYEAGRLDYKPHITELGNAARIIALRDAPESIPVPLAAAGIGNAVFAGFGGEAFTAYGKAIRDLAPDRFVICTVCTDGYEGYIPTADAFSQGGYEVQSSHFSPPIQKEILDAFAKMLK